MYWEFQGPVSRAASRGEHTPPSWRCCHVDIDTSRPVHDAAIGHRESSAVGRATSFAQTQLVEAAAKGKGPLFRGPSNLEPGKRGLGDRILGGLDGAGPHDLACRLGL